MKSKSSKNQRGLGSKAEGSFDIFRRLKQSLHDLSPSDTRRRLLPSHGLDVHSVKIIPHDSDMGIFRTPDNKREEEEVLYIVAALNRGAGTVEDDTMLARKLEQLEVRYASEKASELSKLEVLENKLRMEKEEEMQELKMEKKEEMEQLLRKLDAANANKEAEMRELKEEKEKEMEQLLLLEERLRRLDVSNPNNMNFMFAVQGFVLLVGCTIAATAMYFHMKRSNN
ncbi:predicted protein [Chaetoceros tenuissimus]|nr:predicted protein [Chaetoceros tenuissimus]